MNNFATTEDLFDDLLRDYQETKRDKIIVVTDGSNPVHFYRVNKTGIETESVKVPKVKKEEIIDTTGAGDSFVAGFLYGLIEGKDIKECIELGCDISAKVIKVLGCNLLPT
jgi:adenosine kinase